jgi:hypothetical protein
LAVVQGGAHKSPPQTVPIHRIIGQSMHGITVIQPRFVQTIKHRWPKIIVNK